MTGRADVEQCPDRDQPETSAGCAELYLPPMATPAASGGFGGVALPELGLGELAAFVILAEERSFTRSARRMHLSQPGLSARIARLERSLGVRLVNRTTRTVELTAEGEALLPVASSALEAFAAVRARFAAAEVEPLSVVRARYATGEARRRNLVAEARATNPFR